MDVIVIKNSLLNSCCYLLESNDKVWLVDVGDNVAFLKEKIGNNGINGIFITHCHFDHTYGLSQLLDFYPLTKIYCSELTCKGLMDEEINLSYLTSDKSFKLNCINNIVILKEGKYLLNGLEVQVIASPGHSNDCFTYIISDNIFTGDSYIPFAKVFAKWPTSNCKLAIESENKLRSIIKQKNLKVYCGHYNSK